MASGFFAVLDDIAALMDDVAVTAKVATKQTAGVLGDDLAVNAEKATGFVSSREIPVLLKIMKGSLLNKVILVPVVFFFQWIYPPAIKYVLILGGLYLAYEGVDKIIEYFFHKNEHAEIAETVLEAVEEPKNDAEVEKMKVKSAIQTDFILSLEIVIIALGTVLDKPLAVQIITVSIVSVLATIGVYGIVALIVRMDDAGYKIIRESRSEKGFLVSVGNFLVNALPWVIKLLGIVGTVALILVAGGIFHHNIEKLHHFLPDLHDTLKQGILGIGGGLVMVPVILLIKKISSTLMK